MTQKHYFNLAQGQTAEIKILGTSEGDLIAGTFYLRRDHATGGLDSKHLPGYRSNLINIGGGMDTGEVYLPWDFKGKVAIELLF